MSQIRHAAALVLLLVLTVAAGSAEAWSVSPSKGRYAPGEQIVIRFSNFSDPRDWISVVKAGSPSNHYVDGYWTYIDRDSGAHTFRGLPAGTYEVRAYCCWGSTHGGYNIRAKATFVVGQGPAAGGGGGDDDLARASVGGKYSGLIQRLTCPADRNRYGAFNDYGYWAGGAWCRQQGQAGYWVWVAPTWYVWRNRR